MSPAMQRSRVDLPEPDLPSSATISPSRRVKVMPSRTGSACPSGVVNALVTLLTSTIAAMVVFFLLLQAVPGFGQVVEASPEEPVGGHHVDRHDSDPDQDPAEVPVAGGLGDVGAQAGGDQMVVAVVDDLGDDRGVPRPAGGGDP